MLIVILIEKMTVIYYLLLFLWFLKVSVFVIILNFDVDARQFQILWSSNLSLN